MGLVVTSNSLPVQTSPQTPFAVSRLDQKIYSFVRQIFSSLYLAILRLLKWPGSFFKKETAVMPQSPAPVPLSYEKERFWSEKSDRTGVLLSEREAEEIGLPKVGVSFISLSPEESSEFNLNGRISISVLWGDGISPWLSSPQLNRTQLETFLSHKSKIKELFIKSRQVQGLTKEDVLLTASNATVLLASIFGNSPIFKALSLLLNSGIQFRNIFKSFSTLNADTLKSRAALLALGLIPEFRALIVVTLLATKVNDIFLKRKPLQMSWKERGVVGVHLFNLLCTINQLFKDDLPRYKPPKPESPLRPLSAKSDPFEFLTQDGIQSNRAEHAQQVFKHLKQIPACPPGNIQTGGCADICAKLSKAFRSLSLKMHPDKNPKNSNAPAAFVNLSNARDTLANMYKCVSKKASDDTDLG